jgi:transposase
METIEFYFEWYDYSVGYFLPREDELQAHYQEFVEWQWMCEVFIPKQRAAHSSGLGKVRWVVERTISWLKGLRRLRVRYDRLAVIQDAWTTLAASVICFRLLQEAPLNPLIGFVRAC